MSDEISFESRCWSSLLHCLMKYHSRVDVGHWVAILIGSVFHVECAGEFINSSLQQTKSRSITSHDVIVKNSNF